MCAHAERQFNEPANRPEGTLADLDGYDLAWKALLRLLDRLDPTYKT